MTAERQRSTLERLSQFTSSGNVCLCDTINCHHLTNLLSLPIQTFVAEWLLFSASSMITVTSRLRAISIHCVKPICRCSRNCCLLCGTVIRRPPDCIYH